VGQWPGPRAQTTVRRAVRCAQVSAGVQSAAPEPAPRTAHRAPRSPGRARPEEFKQTGPAPAKTDFLCSLRHVAYLREPHANERALSHLHNLKKTFGGYYLPRNVQISL
jgi:hypothetical protein